MLQLAHSGLWHCLKVKLSECSSFFAAFESFFDTKRIDTKIDPHGQMVAKMALY